MKINFKKLSKLSAIIVVIAFVLTSVGLNTTISATEPDLGAAASFSILAQTAITGTGTISGNVGMNSTGAAITGLTAAMVGGTIYSTDGAAPSTAIIAPAVQANASNVFTNTIPAQGSDGAIGPELNGVTVTPGVYDIGAGRLSGGVLTLNGAGIYIFRASSDFISSGSINLTNGARACDVYWRVQTLATINGSSFTGTILSGTGVHFGDSVALDGRALAVGGDVTLLNNTISGPDCTTAEEPFEDPLTPKPVADRGIIRVIKKVINNYGGTAVASDFTLNITGTNVSTSSFAGSETGVDIVLDAGSYSVTEPVLPTGYLISSSSDCSGTIAAGQTKICTITNTDMPSTIVDQEVVVVPKMPDTGIGFDGKSVSLNIVMLIGIFMASIFLYFAPKRKTI